MVRKVGAREEVGRECEQRGGGATEACGQQWKCKRDVFIFLSPPDLRLPGDCTSISFPLPFTLSTLKTTSKQPKAGGFISQSRQSTGLWWAGAGTGAGPTADDLSLCRALSSLKTWAYHQS